MEGGVVLAEPGSAQSFHKIYQPTPSKITQNINQARVTDKGLGCNYHLKFHINFYSLSFMECFK